MPACRLRPRALAAATVLALGAGLLGLVPAHAAPVGTITGTVSGTQDPSLANWPVSLYRYDPGADDWSDIDFEVTDGSGVYTFTALEPATYRVQFGDGPGYLGEYWDDAVLAEDAAAIVLTEEDPTFDADAELARDSRISGTVTGADGALEGVSVWVYSYDDGADEWDSFTSSTTDFDGNYSIAGLRAGTYRIGFEPWQDTYVDEFWQDAPTVELATDVELGAGAERHDIDARLAEGGQVTGTVTGPDGEGLSDVEVVAYRFFVDSGQWWDVASARTDEDGSYDLAGLETDDYRIEFVDDGGRDYLDEFYDDVPDFVDAEKVSVTAEQTTGNIDARLTSGGAISGTVTGGGGPLEETEVDVYRYDPDGEYWRNVGDALTDADGSYQVDGLHSGRYRVEFSPSDRGFVGEYWDDAPDQDSATDVVVVEGETTEEIDADLATSGSVSGSVTDASGESIAGVLVTAYQYGDEWGWENIGNVATDDEGEYVIADLPPGAVRLGFYDPTGQGFLEEYWEDAPSREEADDVAVVSGKTTAVGTAELELAGGITGVVTGDGGTPLTGIYVKLWRYDAQDEEWTDAGAQYVGSGGVYTFRGIAADDYRIEFQNHGGGGYLNEFWQDAATLAEAEDIAVPSGTTVAIPDARLNKGGTMTGTVTDEDGAPLQSVTVVVQQWQAENNYWQPVDYTSTAANGTYEVDGLYAAPHRVKFDPPGDDYLEEWWRDAHSEEDAEEIDIEAGDAITGVGAALAPAAKITGTLTSASGGPASNVWVGLWAPSPTSASGWEQARSAWTDSNGDYTVGGLAAGTYRVQFGDEWSGPFIGEFWKDAASLAAADDIEMQTGETMEDVDAELAVNGAIAGKVTGPDGRALANISVQAHRWVENDGGYWAGVESDSTADNGRYEIRGLVTGTYRLRFQGESSRDLATEWWDDAASLGEATDIAVEAGETTTGKNARLERAGHISGIVTDERGRGLDEVEAVAHRFVDGTWQEVDDAEDSSNAVGRYDIGSLAPGTYRVGFFARDGDRVVEYWDDSLTIGGADDIEVAAGRTVGGKDAQLARAGRIRGQVTDPTGDELFGIDVTAFMRVGGTWQEVAREETAPWGSYEIGGLVPGTYRLRFVDDEDYGYATEFWDDAPTLARATDITVTVGDSDAQYDTVLEESLEVTNTGAPTISGTRRVGATLTASPGTWTPASGLSFDYQWRVGGTDVGGATGTTYVPTAGDVGKPVSVTVTAYAGSRGSATATSAPTVAVAAAETPAVVNATLPTISGTIKVGSTVTATPGTWTPADSTPTYQWLVGGAPVAGATSASYTPTRADAGKSLQVRVTASKAGYIAGSAVSPARTVARGTIALKGRSRLTGKVIRGGTLTVAPAKATTSGVKAKIQWYAGKQAIKKASGKKLTISGATLKAVTGKKVSVTITYTAPGHRTEVVTLKAKGTIKPKKKGKGRR